MSFDFSIMDYLKTFNVITLSFLLILTGCFGLMGDEEEDSVEAEDSSSTSALTAQDIADAMILATNSPPELSVKKFLTSTQDYENAQMLHNNWEPNGYFNCPTAEEFVDDDGNDIGNTLEEQRASIANSIDESEYRDYMHLANLIEVGDCIIYFDFVSVDPDGDSMTKGIDTNFDGVIDIPITPNDGYTLVGIDNSTSKQVFNGLITVSCTQIDLAFIAIDEHGASTVEFMHFIGVESCDEEDDEDDDVWSDLDYCVMENCALVCLNPSDPSCAACIESNCPEDDDDSPVFITFSGVDAPADAGVLVTMSQGADANFAGLDIRVSINGGQGVNCDATCYTEAGTADQTWTVGEDLAIAADCGQDDTGADITTCNVTVTVFDNRENTQIGNAVTIAMDETA